ncbi:MAG: DUF3887 domain-containing protein [Oscillospiraceae bacterium]
MKKLLSISLVLVMAVAMLTGCGGSKLADCFVEKDVISTAKLAIDALNNGDYEGTVGYLKEDLQAQLPAEKLEESVKPTMEKMGAFKDYGDTAVVGSVSKDTNEDFAIALISANYENGTITYTIGFDKDMQMVQFFLK